VLAADLSGLSKAEVERIWLPFAVWFAAGAALLPARHRRWWLAVQALTALAVNHLLVTNW
jgi:methylthioxylose transferase